MLHISTSRSQAIEGTTLAVDIPAQPIRQALSAFARETGVQLVYVSGVVRNQKSRPATAGMDAREALSHLLQGTGLAFEYLTPRSVRIVAAAPVSLTTRSNQPQDEVLITGTRLSTPMGIPTSAIISVSASDVRETGLTRVEDVLNNLPMLFADTTAAVNSSADGTAALNLRGLGSRRTLVLVDGMRLGPGSADGRNWSDVNQLPAALIQRIDVLTGGASATYGADAVAGVVNFIINTHYEGVRIDAGYHFNQHYNDSRSEVASTLSAAGDALPPSSVNTAPGRNASLLFGTNFLNDRGNVTAYVTYDSQSAALLKQFDYSACAFNPPVTAVLTCYGSDTSAGGRFLASGNEDLSSTIQSIPGLAYSGQPRRVTRTTSRRRTFT